LKRKSNVKYLKSEHGREAQEEQTQHCGHPRKEYASVPIDSAVPSNPAARQHRPSIHGYRVMIKVVAGTGFKSPRPASVDLGQNLPGHHEPWVFGA
jgi:hypothetical protein